jgi:hypothetical protein
VRIIIASKKNVGEKEKKSPGSSWILDKQGKANINLEPGRR